MDDPFPTDNASPRSCGEMEFFARRGAFVVRAPLCDKGGSDR